jgi:hypothetical protein
MAETDVVAHLVDLLQDQGSDVRQSSTEIIEVITALAKYGWLIDHLYRVRTDDPGVIPQRNSTPG